MAAIQISGPTRLVAGQTATYAAKGTDGAGNSVAVSPQCGASGGAMADGVWTAPTKSGTYTVTASAKGITAPLPVTVVPGPVARVIVSGPGTVSAGRSVAFSATALDQFDNPLVAPAISWSATGGSVSATGLFTAPATAGTATVVATAGGVSGSAIVCIQAPPPPPTPGGGNGTGGLPGQVDAGDTQTTPAAIPTPPAAEVVASPATVLSNSPTEVSVSLPAGTAPNPKLMVYCYDDTLKTWLALPTSVQGDKATATVPGGAAVMLMQQQNVQQPPDTADHWSNAYVLKLESLGISAPRPEPPYCD